MHAQAWGCVHFDHAAALFFKGAQHRFAHHVDATNVQADHLGRCNGTQCHFRVHVIGHVGGRATRGEIGVVAQNHACAFGRHGVGFKALLFEARDGDVVKPNLGQGRGVAFTATWVGIHNVDQLAHGVFAVANHQWGFTACCSYELVAHHQQAVVTAG